MTIAHQVTHEARPWGTWQVVDAGDGYAVKRIVVRPHARLSYQTHAHRSEHWVVVAGTATCTIDGETFVVAAGGCVDVRRESAHRLANDQDHDLLVLEVQRGAHISEDDIHRLEDDYGRHTQEEG
jgi:mannose-6-phosphate isomerase